MVHFDGETHRPLLTVVVLTWNREASLGECLNSILSHTEKPFELIVVNNGSTDGTRKYLDELEATGKLKGIHLDINCGVTARNYAFKIATTPFIAQIDDDVTVHSSWSKLALDQFTHDEKLGIVAAQGAVIPNWLDFEVTFSEGLVDCATGFCMILRNLGLLYDDAFAPFWHEEVDLSFQYRIRGYRIRTIHGMCSHNCKRDHLDSAIERRNYEYVKLKWGDKIPQLNLIGKP